MGHLPRPVINGRLFGLSPAPLCASAASALRSSRSTRCASARSRQSSRTRPGTVAGTWRWREILGKSMEYLGNPWKIEEIPWKSMEKLANIQEIPQKNDVSRCFRLELFCLGSKRDGSEIHDHQETPESGGKNICNYWLVVLTILKKY